MNKGFFGISAPKEFPVRNLDYGYTVLGGAFSVAGAAGTFVDIGLSLRLPCTGIYDFSANIRLALTGNAGTVWWMSAQLFNATDGVAITDSERLGVLTAQTGVLFQMTCPINMPVAVFGPKTIKVYVARNGSPGASWTTSTVESNIAGRTTLAYKKVMQS